MAPPDLTIILQHRQAAQFARLQVAQARQNLAANGRIKLPSL
jgi:hypothetical protein